MGHNGTGYTSVARLVVLGARGDLVSRHTLSALAHLEDAGLIPSRLRVVAVDREPLTTADYRADATWLLATHASAVPEQARRRLVDRLDYRAADVLSAPDLRDSVGQAPCLVYLALPPAVTPAAVRLLARSGLAPGSRVLAEKPFGSDRASAADLETLLREVVEERAVLRADHFLHQQLLRDVLSLRFDSGLLEPLWSRRHVERVEVVWEESSPVAGRAEFYDRTGALRDMVQSHLMQLLAAVAMEAPASFDPADLRAARVDVLARVRPPDRLRMSARTFRGRYVAGVGQADPDLHNSPQVRAYVDEHGVEPGRMTETYARVDLEVTGARWQDVPFSLRTGRAIGAPRRHVQVRFRPRSEGTGAGPGGRQVLTFDRGGAEGPASTRISMATDGAWSRDMSRWGDLRVERQAQPLPASALLLRDALAGDPRWCLAAEEVDHSWRVVDAVLDGWRSGSPPLVDYPAGSPGPEPRT